MGLLRNILEVRRKVLRESGDLEVGSIDFYGSSIKNLNVNGAGDLFAGLFIENYFNLGLIESSKIAMSETTNILKNRK